MGRPTNAELQSKVKELNATRVKLEKALAQSSNEVSKERSLSTQARGKLADLEQSAAVLREEVAGLRADRGAPVSLEVQLRTAVAALREISEAGWPRLSRPLISTASLALSKIREQDGAQHADPLERLDSFVHGQSEVYATLVYQGRQWSVAVEFGLGSDVEGSLSGADRRLRPAIVQALSGAGRGEIH